MAKKKSKWIHPIHARGIQSPKFTVRGGKLLTDKKIEEYMRLGKYGTELQAIALARLKEKKSSRKARATEIREALRWLITGGKL